jgi:uncharacterized protein YeaO (DUF488 family)
VIKTKRWCDAIEPDDGFRVLIARYLPRGVSTAEQTWTGFMPQLGPSKALHAAFYGKEGEAIPLAEYRTRYLQEMAGQRLFIRALAEHVRSGKNLTLLCSSACSDEQACHRTLLRGLIEAELASLAAPEQAKSVIRRKK